MCQEELSTGHTGDTSAVIRAFLCSQAQFLVGYKVRPLILPVLAWLGFAEGCLPQSPCQQSGHAYHRAHFRPLGNRREMPDSPDESGLGGRLRVRKASACKGVQLPRAGSQSSRAGRRLGCLTSRRVLRTGEENPTKAACLLLHFPHSSQSHPDGISHFHAVSQDLGSTGTSE